MNSGNAALILSTSQALNATMNVEVHSNNSHASDAAADSFIPWRIGSEKHLGIRRCSALDSTFDPPPYDGAPQGSEVELVRPQTDG